MGVEYGIPEDNCAIRATMALPGQRTLPMHTSCTSAGEMADEGTLERQPLRAVERRVEGDTFANPPFRARQSGVRTALTMTTSRGLL